MTLGEQGPRTAAAPMNGLVRASTLGGQVKVTGREGSCLHPRDCASGGLAWNRLARWCTTELPVGTP